MKQILIMCIFIFSTVFTVLRAQDAVLKTPLELLTVATKEHKIVIPNSFLNSDIRSISEMESLEFSSELKTCVTEAAIEWFDQGDFSAELTKEEIYLNSLFDGLGYMPIEKDERPASLFAASDDDLEDHESLSLLNDKDTRRLVLKNVNHDEVDEVKIWLVNGESDVISLPPGQEIIFEYKGGHFEYSGIPGTAIDFIDLDNSDLAPADNNKHNLNFERSNLEGGITYKGFSQKDGAVLINNYEDLGHAGYFETVHEDDIYHNGRIIFSAYGIEEVQHIDIKKWGTNTFNPENLQKITFKNVSYNNIGERRVRTSGWDLWPHVNVDWEMTMNYEGDGKVNAKTGDRMEQIDLYHTLPLSILSGDEFDFENHDDKEINYRPYWWVHGTIPVMTLVDFRTGNYSCYVDNDGVYGFDKQMFIKVYPSADEKTLFIELHKTSIAHHPDVSLLKQPERSTWLELHFKEKPSVTGFYTVARNYYKDEFGTEEALLLDHIAYKSSHEEWGFSESYNRWYAFAFETGEPEAFAPNFGGVNTYKALQEVFHKKLMEFKYEYDDNGRVTNMEDHPYVVAARTAVYYAENSEFADTQSKARFEVMNFRSAKDWIDIFNQNMALEFAELDGEDVKEEYSGLKKFGRVFYGICTFGGSEAVRALVKNSEAYNRSADDWNWEINQLVLRGRYSDIPRNNRDQGRVKIYQNTIEVAGAVMMGFTGEDLGEAGIAICRTFVTAARKLTSGFSMFLGSRYASNFISAEEFASLPSMVFHGGNTHPYVTFEGTRFPVVANKSGNYVTAISRVHGAGEEALYEYNPATRVQGQRIYKIDGKFVDPPHLLGGGKCSSRPVGSEGEGLEEELPGVYHYGDDIELRPFRPATDEGEVLYLDDITPVGYSDVDKVSILSESDLEKLRRLLIKDDEWLISKDRFLFPAPDDAFPEDIITVDGEDYAEDIKYMCDDRAQRIASNLHKSGIEVRLMMCKHIDEATGEAVEIAYAEGASAEVRYEYHVAPYLAVKKADGTIELMVLDPRLGPAQEGISTMDKWKKFWDWSYEHKAKFTVVEPTFYEGWSPE